MKAEIKHGAVRDERGNSFVVIDLELRPVPGEDKGLLVALAEMSRERPLSMVLYQDYGRLRFWAPTGRAHGRQNQSSA